MFVFAVPDPLAGGCKPVRVGGTAVKQSLACKQARHCNTDICFLLQAVPDPLASGCKPVRVAVTVAEGDAPGGPEDAHLAALPSGELPALARRYAIKVRMASGVSVSFC